jgi:hypothetical protein
MPVALMLPSRAQAEDLASKEPEPVDTEHIGTVFSRAGRFLLGQVVRAQFAWDF